MPDKFPRQHIERRFEDSSPLGSVTAAGQMFKTESQFKVPYRVFGRYAAMYVLDGGGVYQDDNGLVQTITAGDMIMVFPDLAHFYGPGRGQVWWEYFLVFEGPVFDLWRQQGLIDPRRPIVHIEPVSYWYGRMQQVAPAQEPVADMAESALLRVNRLCSLLGEMLTVAGHVGEGSQPRWLAQARAWLETPNIRSRRLGDLAGDLHMSEATLRRRFTEAMGISPQQYRDQCMIQAAQRQMMQGGLNDRQIAYELGFDDPAYFSRRFKQLVGESPRSYRSRIRKMAQKHVSCDDLSVML